jgi:phosphoglycerate kinase
VTGQRPRGPLTGLPLLEHLPEVDGRRVLVRADFNVPLRAPTTPGGPAQIEDDFRIRAALETIGWLTTRGAQVTVCTHLGRPGGSPDPRYDVAPVRARLEELAPGVELLDNLRFDPGEESDSPEFVDHLVKGMDLYVNDAFGASHRAHASVMGPPARLPSAAGRLMQREVKVLGGLLHQPPRPFVAVVGGAKVADKLGVLRALLERVDRLAIGGAMAFTFWAAQGRPVGASLVEPLRVPECRRLLAEAGDRLLLPCDVVALSPEGTLGHGATGEGETRVVADGVPAGWRGVDIGPKSSAGVARLVASAGTVLWNGPMGVFEDNRFAAGTKTVAVAVADTAAFTVVGGGDSVAALERLGLKAEIDFVSTGGGASLEFLEHGDLPGLTALRAAVNAPATA